MKNRKAILPLVLLMGLGLTAATTVKEEKQTIVSPVQESHDSAWYARQSVLWQAEIKKDRTNETAWANYYRANRYRQWYSSKYDSELLRNIIADMAKAIPESYTYNLLQYANENDLRYAANLEKAMQMRPDNIADFPTYVGYLLLCGKEKELKEFTHRWYESGAYSTSLLNYAYNELVGLDEGAIIFTNGDSPTFSKLILQNGKGLFADKVVICTSMLWADEYRGYITEKLQLPAFDMKTLEGLKSQQQQEEALLMHIIRNAHRPVYFSTTYDLPSFKDKLYSEGLVMKYSERKYNNLAVKQCNYEERYLMDYLYESFSPDRYEASTRNFNLNYIPCFKSLLDHYKAVGDTRHYKALYNTLKRVVYNVDPITDEKRKAYYEELDR